MKTLLTCVILRLSFILCLNDDDEHLIRMVTEEYKFDYQVIIVDEKTRMINFVRNQAQFSQIVLMENVDIIFQTCRELGNVGFFVFLEDTEMAKYILSQVTPGMLEDYSWFIDTDNIQDTGGIKLKFDSDINIIHKTKKVVKFYELYQLQDRVVKSLIGKYENGFLEIKTTNKLKRRTNLNGLTLRYLKRVHRVKILKTLEVTEVSLSVLFSAAATFR